MIIVSLKKRTIALKNATLFVLMAFLFYLLTQQYLLGFSFNNDPEVFVSLIKQNIPMFIFCLVTSVWVFYWLPWVEWIFLAYFLSVLSPGLFYVFEYYDKIILLSSFIFSLLSIAVLLILKTEGKRAIYRPSFFSNQLGGKSYHPLKVELQLRDKKYSGELTNWDLDSCFMHFSDEIKEVRGMVELTFFFDDLSFSSRAQVTSSYDKGLGVRILNFPKNSQKEKVPGWAEYFSIISDRGYQNEV